MADPNPMFDDDVFEPTEAVTEIPGFELFEDSVELGEGATHSPTIMIGLGGTGCQVLLRVKRFFAERGAESSLHRYLFIDTDLKTFSKTPGLPPVGDDEGYLIGMRQARRLLAAKDQHPHVWKRFPPGELNERYIEFLARGDGAGQIRAAGALALVLDYENVRAKFEAVYDDVVGFASRLRARMGTSRQAMVGNDVVIYIVGSLSGGTGSGCFLDVAMLAQDVCRNHNPQLVGVFSLPDAYDEKVENDSVQTTRTRVNTYAALKELQYVLDSGADFRRPIVLDYGQDRTLELKVSDNLFSLCYLVDNRNAIGSLSKIDDLYELMARSIFQDVGSRFGAHRRSFDRNCSTVNGVSLCPRSGLLRQFSSVATSALVYPALRVAKYCTYRTIGATVQDRLLKAAPTAGEIENVVDSFLAANELDDRSPSDQILDSLLNDSERGEIVSSATLGVAAGWGRSLKASAFASKLEGARIQFESTELGRVRDKIVGPNLALRLGTKDEPVGDPIGSMVSDLAFKTATAYGVPGVIAVLENLEDTAQAIKRELEKETSEWVETGRSDALQRINSLRASLARFNPVFERLRSKDDKLKAQLITAFNNYVDGELWALARGPAIQILETLVNRAKDARATWNTLLIELQGLARETQVVSRRLEAEGGRTVRSFVVEVEVTRPGYERRYFEQNAVKPAEAFSTLEGRHGGSDGFYKAILRQRRKGIAVLMAREIYPLYAEPLKTVKVIDFVKNRTNKAEVDANLEQKLDSVFEMCRPFWLADPLVAGEQFPEFVAASVHPNVKGTGEMTAPPEMTRWIKSHGGQLRKTYEIIPSDVPYEIVLSRRTHGARGFYLKQADGWKTLYLRQRKSAGRQYPLEVGAQFKDIPDLFPEAKGLMRTFALALALGFIATRGDWYYFNLEEQPNGQLVVLKSSQWTTIGEMTGVEAGRKVGNLLFKLTRGKPSAKLRLGQGRSTAFRALTRNPGQQDMIARALAEYEHETGNATFKRELDKYVEQVLSADAGSDKKNAPHLKEEKQAIQRATSRMGA